MMGPTTISFTDEKDMIKKNNKPTLDKENNFCGKPTRSSVSDANCNDFFQP